MNLWASFIANPQPAKLMQPSDSSLDDPTMHTESAAMQGVPFRKHGSNAPFSQGLSMRFRIIAPISLHPFRTAARASRLSADWWNGFDQGDQLGHIVGVRTSQKGRQGNALRIRNDVMLATRFRSICGVWTCFFPPRRARTEALSTIARDQSI
jgi:hypothetical protein